jgi:vacuolar-type H+-ATPase subunit H
MSQEAISQILAVEQAAAQLYEEAQKQAERTITEAQNAASALREQLLDEARKEAARLATEAREEAAARRARVLEQTEAEIRRLDEVAGENLERAVRFVLDRVMDRE